MFRFKKNKVPALSTKSRDSDSGTVRKNKKKYIDKDEHIHNSIAEEELSPKSESSNENKNDEELLNEEHRSSPSPNTLEPNINLSRDELLKLLSVFEGELQARDEVIAILKSECTQNSDARYGLTSQPLKALQRDAATLDVTSQDHVCEQTKDQMKKIIQHQKESYRKLKQMHLAAEEKYQRLSTDMEEEKRKHQEYIMKSDDFVNLLEHDRERLKQILEQEKTSHERKERDLTWKLKENKEEIARMKTLSLELVEERQQQLQAYNEQKQLVTALQQQAEEMQSKVQEMEVTTATEKEHATQLENELEEQTNKFYKDYEDLNAKLTEERTMSKEKDERIKSLGRQIKKLKCVDKNLRKTDDQLWRIKEKLEQEERHEDLLEEVELLRKTVADMQEAEKIYTQAQEECADLRETLEKEVSQTTSIRVEVEKLRNSVRNKKDTERCVEEAMFKLDDVFQKFEAERKKADKMKEQIEDYRAQLTKINESERLLEMSEVKLKQLHALAQERKEAKSSLETQLHLEREKSAQYKEMIEDERTKVTEVTQKTIEESKKVLKLKEKLAALETKRGEENASLHRKLEEAEESIRVMITKEKASQMEALVTSLRKQVAMLKKRLDQLESETDKRENEVRIAKEEAEKAKQNLNLSTEKLKRLVAVGLNEQLALAQCEEMKQKHSTLEITNASLLEEVKALEAKLQQGTTLQANSNNNNISIKRDSVNKASSYALSSEEKGTPPHGRRTSSASRDKTTTPKTVTTRRVSNSTKRDLSVDRTRQNGVTSPRTVLKLSNTTQQNAPVSPANRIVNGAASAGSKNTKPFLTRMKSSENRMSSSYSAVSMTISHDPSEEATPHFRITKDGKTGMKQIETSTADGKKGSQVRRSSRSGDTQSSHSRPPSASGVRSPRPAASGKMTSKVTVTSNNNSPRATSESKTKKLNSIERRSSVSPTSIPKLRSSTPTPSSPVTRTSTTPR